LSGSGSRLKGPGSKTLIRIRLLKISEKYYIYFYFSGEELHRGQTEEVPSSEASGRAGDEGLDWPDYHAGAARKVCLHLIFKICIFLLSKTKLL